MDLSKAARKAIRDAADIAYERELAAALEDVEQAFADWRGGKISPFDVSERIHEFHQGSSRDLYGRYSQTVPDFAVAAAVMNGFIELSEVPAAGREHIAGLLRALPGRAV